jgi:hypothetical protein
LIDGVTGQVIFDPKREPLGPALRLSAFLETPLGGAAKLVVRNDPWRTLHLANFVIGGRPFGAMLVFEGERLATVILCIVDPGNTLGYEQLDAAHRRWLAAAFRGGRPWRPDENERRFAWGTVWVGLDVKSGAPEIVVSYR